MRNGCARGRAIIAAGAVAASVGAVQPFPGTAPLDGTNDFTDAYLSGLERLLLRETAQLAPARERLWREGLKAGGPDAAAWLVGRRSELSRLLGVCNARTAFESPSLSASLSRSAVLGETSDHVLYEIRWPVFGDFWAEGLLMEPKSKPVRRNEVFLPHAGVTPEHVLGLAPGAPDAFAGFAFPAPGCRLVIPAVVSRVKSVFESGLARPGKGQMPGRMRMPDREFVYRPAYTFGRHIIGYEVQEVLALVDWFRRENAAAAVRVAGWGDGGMLALYAGALDARIDETAVAGYFDRRDDLWREPVDRNVFGLLQTFSDAEVAVLIAPRRLTVLAVPGPVETITREMGKEGGAPGRLASPAPESVRRETSLAGELAAPLKAGDWLTLSETVPAAAPVAVRTARLPDAAARERRIVDGMNGYSQRLLALSPDARRAFLSRLDYASPDAYDRSADWYRAYYRDEVMGRLRVEKAALNPRSRLLYETPAYACYEMTLDVAQDFVLHGYLLWPKGIRVGERRPAVVAQHGRGGSPKTVMDAAHGGRATYHAIAPRLAEKGYVVFAPQNPYVQEDRYRQLVRIANPVKLTLYSIIAAQYEQLFAWLATLPQVDSARIAFIGQSYGGKTAVRVPPVMPGFCLAISTGDFNEGVTKMASTLHPFSFALWDEYEMFEFNLGNTFNYADLAALMAPRPFMVERGHGDTVAWDEFVGYEYARVRQTYARLKIPERTAIDWFEGGHEIDIEPALTFIDQFLKAR